MRHKYLKILKDIELGIPLGCLTIEERDLLAHYLGNNWEQFLSDMNNVKNEIGAWEDYD